MIMPSATQFSALTSDHTKYLNTPRLVADDTQKTVWKWEQQEPFGASTINDDPDADNIAFEFNFRFPGQYFDRETSAHYNYFRDYESLTGRYLQSDPFGLLAGLNTYGYALGIPITYTDPTGEVVPIVGAVLVKVAIGAAKGAGANVGFQFGVNVIAQLTNGSSPFDPDVYFRAGRCVDWAAVGVAAGIGTTGAPGFLGAAGSVGKALFNKIPWSVAGPIAGKYAIGAGAAFAINQAIPDVRAGCENECKGVGLGGLFSNVYQFVY